jgi:hypothetical protein
MTRAIALLRRRAVLLLALAVVSAALVGATCWRRAQHRSAPAAHRASPPLSFGPVRPSPLAARLCTTLHALPGRRAAECCETHPSQNLYEECLDGVSRSLASGAIELDASSIAGCERAMVAQLSGCDWVRPGLPLAPAACQGLIKGRVASGGACRSSLECASHLHCVVASGASHGRCTPPEPLGAICGRSTDALAAYALERTAEAAHPWCADFCSLVTHRCEPTPLEGAACRADINCAVGQRCSQGACRPGPDEAQLADTGQACRADFECARGGCIASGAAGAGICGKRCSTAPSRTGRAAARSEHRNTGLE